MNQSVWREDLFEAEPTDGATIADKKPAASETVAVLEENAGKVETPDKPEKSVDRAADDEPRKAEKADRARARRERDVAEERSSRKAQARGERRSRTARAEHRRSQAQIAFAERSYERRPERPSRSAEQITSLGIRASVSSIY